MPHFHCYFLALVNSAIDLTHRARGDGLRLELIKDLLYLLPVRFSEVLLGGFKRVRWCLFP